MTHDAPAASPTRTVTAEPLRSETLRAPGKLERGLSRAAALTPASAPWDGPPRPVPAHPLRTGTVRGPALSRAVTLA